MNLITRVKMAYRKKRWEGKREERDLLKARRRIRVLSRTIELQEVKMKELNAKIDRLRS